MIRNGTLAGRLSANAEAVLWVTLATAIFSIIFAAPKMAGDAGATFQILLLRYVGGLATLLAMVALRRQPLSVYRSARPLSHLGRAATGGLGGCCIMFASAAMPIADATAIGLLYGVFAVLFGVLLLGETVCGRHWRAALLCAGGAAVVVAGQGAFSGAFAGADGGTLVPVAVALLGALLLAIESVQLRILSIAERPLTVLLYVNVFGIALMAGPAIATWGTRSLHSLLPFAALGPLAITAQYCNVRGYRLGPIALLAPVEYSWLGFAALLGLVAFGEVPGPATLAGSALILVGGVALARLPAPATAR